MRRNTHVRFGGRAEETDRPKGSHRASARPDHSHAAMLIAQGEHPKVIQNRLGHSSIKVTLDTYGHLFDGLDEAAAERLDATFQPTPSGRVQLPGLLSTPIIRALSERS